MVQSNRSTTQDGDPGTMGAIVRRRRQALDWMQKDLAREAGLDPATVTRIESNSVRPAPETLARLAKALGLELSDLYAAAGLPSGGDLLPPFQPYLRAKYRDLPPEAHERIARYVARVRAEYGDSDTGPADGEDE